MDNYTSNDTIINTTIFPNTTLFTTDAPYVMSDETKVMICLALSFFVIPSIIIILIGFYDIVRHFMGIRDFTDGILMRYHNGKMKKRSFINSLITIEIKDLDDDCPICMEKLNGRIGYLSCEHYFHEECLIKWLKTSEHKDCPTCRNKDYG